MKRRIIVAIAAAVLSLGVWLLRRPTPIRTSGQATAPRARTMGGRSVILRARRRRSPAASRSRSTEALCGLGMHSRGHTPARSDRGPEAHG